MKETLSLNYEMFTVMENELDSDILSGHTLDILLLIQTENRTSTEISRKLNVPIFTTQLYLSRLLKANFIEVHSSTYTDGRIEKLYSLAYRDISILNKISSNNGSKFIDEEKRMQTIQYFNSITAKAIQKATGNEDKPHKIKAYYIKTNLDNMEQFNEELNTLFEKYQALEDENGEETYSLFTILAPVEQ